MIPQHSYLIPKEKVVYGTPERFFALIFIAKFPDEDIRHGYYSNKQWKTGEDKYVLEELKPGMFEKHLKNKSGYIYTVSGNQFVDHENLHLHGLEFISKDPVKVDGIEFVADVLTEVKKSPSVIFFEYDPLFGLKKAYAGEKLAARQYVDGAAQIYDDKRLSDELIEHSKEESEHAVILEKLLKGNVPQESEYGKYAKYKDPAYKSHYDIIIDNLDDEKEAVIEYEKLFEKYGYKELKKIQDDEKKHVVDLQSFLFPTEFTIDKDGYFDANNLIVGQIYYIKDIGQVIATTTTKAKRYMNLDIKMSMISAEKPVGLNVAVFTNMYEISKKSYGLRKLDGDQLKETDIMPIGSISKSILCDAMSKFFLENKTYSWSYPLGKVITKFIDSKDVHIEWIKNKIYDYTLLDVANHRIGAGNDENWKAVDIKRTLFFGRPAFKGYTNKEKRAMFVAAVFEQKPFYEVGKFKYYNGNYGILAAFIEKVTGMNYEDFIRKYTYKNLHFGASNSVTCYKIEKGKTYRMGKNIIPHMEVIADRIYGIKGKAYKMSSAIPNVEERPSGDIEMSLVDGIDYFSKISVDQLFADAVPIGFDRYTHGLKTTHYCKGWYIGEIKGIGKYCVSDGLLECWVACVWIFKDLRVFMQTNTVNMDVPVSDSYFANLILSILDINKKQC